MKTKPVVVSHEMLLALIKDKRRMAGVAHPQMAAPAAKLYLPPQTAKAA